MIPHYIKRKEGKESVTYIFEELKPILESTCGIIVYQEQILEILKNIGGYSYAQADKVRRAMSKKQESVIVKEKEVFISACVNKGFNKDKSEELYNLVLKFANYGFPKSHSVAYSLISYQMAYLKAHHKEHFMINLLNMSKTSETKTKEYIDEAKLLGLTFENIDINLSTNNYVYINNKILFPLSIVKNISESISNTIVMERKNGLFKDFYDFIRRIYSATINKKNVESLIKVSAFSSFNININTLLNNLDKFIEYASLCKKIDYKLVLLPQIDYYDELNKQELLELEFNNLGFYISNHPVTKYNRINIVTLNNIEKYFNKNINTIVLVENIKEIFTKNNEKMAFLTISDEFKKISATIFPKIYNEYINLSIGDIIKVNGRVEKRYDKYELIINIIEILK
jgi:DNA polymerase-3 subunit alpha